MHNGRRARKTTQRSLHARARCMLHGEDPSAGAEHRIAQQRTRAKMQRTHKSKGFRVARTRLLAAHAKRPWQKRGLAALSHFSSKWSPSWLRDWVSRSRNRNGSGAKGLHRGRGTIRKSPATIGASPPTRSGKESADQQTGRGDRSRKQLRDRDKDVTEVQSAERGVNPKVG